MSVVTKLSSARRYWGIKTQTATYTQRTFTTSSLKSNAATPSVCCCCEDNFCTYLIKRLIYSDLCFYQNSCLVFTPSFVTTLHLFILCSSILIVLHLLASSVVLTKKPQLHTNQPAEMQTAADVFQTMQDISPTDANRGIQSSCAV